jgi:predicted O-methyltransferase YrrM
MLRKFASRSSAPDLGVQARHVERSAVASLDDDPATPSERLLDIAEAAIAAARRISLDEISQRISSGPRWPDVWPGEHYKLLAALAAVTASRTIIEIGTFEGLGTLALSRGAAAEARVVTFDVVPYVDVATHIFRDEDFENERIKQVIADVTSGAEFARFAELFEEADLIFVDAAKDGVQERRFLERFESTRFRRPPLIVFDDIRLFNMLQIWRDIRRPKLDLTSFGHWSGTGLVDFG